MYKLKNKKSKLNEEGESSRSSLVGEKKKKKRREEEELQEGVVEKDEEDKGVAFARHQKKITDPRFSSLHSDPRFKPMSRRKSKVPIDSRFSAIFTDEKFASSAPVDKRGRPTRGSSRSALSDYYRLSDDDELREETEKREDGIQKGTKKKKKDGKNKKEKDDEKGKIREERDGYAKEAVELQQDNGSDDELCEDGLVLEDGEGHEDEDLPAYLGSSDSHLSSEEEIGSSDDSFSETDVDEAPEEDVPLVEESTHRLAMVNMDWDHAIDLYVLMNSFLPEGGYIKSVAVYPSEFGLKSMEEDSVPGDDDEESDGNGAEIDEAKHMKKASSGTTMQ